MLGDEAAGSWHGAGAAAESLRPDPQTRAKRTGLALLRAFETSKPTHHGTPPSSRPHLLILPKQFTNWESNIQIHESAGAALIPTIASLAPPGSQWTLVYLTSLFLQRRTSVPCPGHTVSKCKIWLQGCSLCLEDHVTRREARLASGTAQNCGQTSGQTASPWG